MGVTIPDKVFFRIGEVGRILGVEPYVIRYWESEFKSVRPMRTRSDQRLYRQHDIEELLTIKNLLYRDKFTIAGAKKKLYGGKGAPPEQGKSSSADLLDEIKKELQAMRDILA